MRVMDGGGAGSARNNAVFSVANLVKKTAGQVKKTAGQAAGQSAGNLVKRTANNIQKTYAQPKRTYSAPKRTYSAPKRTYSAPKRSYSPPQRSYSPPRPKPYVPPRPAVGSTSKGTIAPSLPKPAPAPTPMTLDQWLAGDTAYMGQKSSYEKALKDYQAQKAGEQGKYTNEYNASVQKLNTDKLNQQTALTDDYAGRGLLQSGVYADALGDFQNNFKAQAADLERAKGAYFGDLATDSTNFTTQQQLQMQQAKDAAAARRAAKYNL